MLEDAAISTTDAAARVDAAAPDDAAPSDAGGPTDDTGPSPACDLAGTWSGTRTDVSGGGTWATAVTLEITQAGGTLTIVPSGTGSIAAADVRLVTGAVDSSGNWYVGRVDAACATITGEGNAFEMAHGPFTLTRL